MTIKMYYKENDVFIEVTSGTDVTNPITTTHNGKSGDQKSVCLYLRNDDVAKWYSNIIVRPVDLVDPEPYGDIAYNETGWGVKLNPGGTEPTETEWVDILWGEPINMSNIGSDSAYDITTYSPFWYLISCPPNMDAQNKSDIVLNAEFTENTVVVP